MLSGENVATIPAHHQGKITGLLRRSGCNTLRALRMLYRRRAPWADVHGSLLLCLACLGLAGLALLYMDSTAVAWPDWLVALSRTVTNIGLSGWYLVPPAIVLVILNLTDWQGLKRQHYLQLHQLASVAFFMLLSIGLSGILINIIKYTVGRARPYVGEGHLAFDPFTTASTYASFPSGHSTTLGAVTGILCLFFPRLRFLFLPAGIFLAATRFIIGVHFLSDVIAGFAIGFGFTLVMALVFARLRCLFRQGPKGYPELRGGLARTFWPDLQDRYKGR